MGGRNTGAPAGSGLSPRPSSQANSSVYGGDSPCQTSSISSAAMRPPLSSASAILAMRTEAPTRRPPVISLRMASLTGAGEASSQPATSAPSSLFGVVASDCTTSISNGGGAFTRRSGHISATVSARSPT